MVKHIFIIFIIFGIKFYEMQETYYKQQDIATSLYYLLFSQEINV